jgi:hypothetical protein
VLLAGAGGREPIADAARSSGHSINPDHVFGRFRCIDFENLWLAVLVRHIDSAV